MQAALRSIYLKTLKEKNRKGVAGLKYEGNLSADASTQQHGIGISPCTDIKASKLLYNHVWMQWGYWHV